MSYITALIIYPAAFTFFLGNVFVIYQYFLTCKRSLEIPAGSVSVFLWMLLAAPILLLIGWLGARNQKGAYTINFSGTSFYGRIPTAQGYITTLWITIFGFPLIPVRSFDIFAEQSLADTKLYSMKATDTLNWPQIGKTLRKGLIILILVEIAVAVFLNILCTAIPGPRF